MTIVVVDHQGTQYEVPVPDPDPEEVGELIGLLRAKDFPQIVIVEAQADGR